MSEIKDTSKCGYYYHPLGELAKAFADGTADDSEWPHTYTKPGKYHGIGAFLVVSAVNDIEKHASVFFIKDA